MAVHRLSADWVAALVQEREPERGQVQEQGREPEPERGQAGFLISSRRVFLLEPLLLKPFRLQPQSRLRAAD